MLDKAFFEPVRNDDRQIIIILGVSHQFPISVTMQQAAKAADKNISVLGHDLRPPIPVLLETPNIHRRQLDPILEHPDVLLLLVVLQHKDSQLRHAVGGGGRSECATHVKQLHLMARVHSRWAHLPERLRHRVHCRTPGSCGTMDPAPSSSPSSARAGSYGEGPARQRWTAPCRLPAHVTQVLAST